MATPYEVIYKRFLQKITDFNLVELDDFTLDEMLNGWLKSAIVRTRACDSLNSTELTLMMIGGKEEKYYSQAAHIKELRDLRSDITLEMQKLHSYHTYTNNSYFDN